MQEAQKAPRWGKLVLLYAMGYCLVVAIALLDDLVLQSYMILKPILFYGGLIVASVFLSKMAERELPRFTGRSLVSFILTPFAVFFFVIFVISFNRPCLQLAHRLNPQKSVVHAAGAR